MPSLNDPCWRDASGAPHLSLPFRVTMPDGSTRTDPTQWSEDADVIAATGWTRSTLTQADLDLLFPPAPPAPPAPEPTWLEAGFLTPMVWRLGWQPDDVALLTGLYVLASRANEMGVTQPCVVTDMAGERHTMTFAEFEMLMLAYGAARAAASAGGET
jgi:hypothetical protein